MTMGETEALKAAGVPDAPGGTKAADAAEAPEPSDASQAANALEPPEASLMHLTPRPPLGWNSFDSYGCAASEQALLANAEAMAERLLPAGYEYFVVDNGWFAEYELEEGSPYPKVKHADEVHIDEYGRYQPSKVYFPNGLQPLIDRVHALGLKFGIHIMRGIPRKAVELNLPVLGTDVRAAGIADRNDVCSWCHYNYGVDMSRPGAQAFYDSLIHQLAAWGVDFIKADDITGHPDEIEAVVRAIRSSGRKMVLSLSPGGQTDPAHMKVYQQANMLRTTRDIWDNRADLNKAFEAWEAYNGFRKEGFWPDLDMIPFGHLQLWNPRSGSNGEGTIRPDSLPEQELSGKGHERMCGLTENQKYTFITIRALAASPLFMGGDLPSSDEFSFRLITNPEMLACNQNGIMGSIRHKADGIEIWAAPHRTLADEGWIGIFNRNRENRKAGLGLRELGFLTEGEVEWINIWGTPQFEASASGLTAEIGGDGVLFLRYRKRKARHS